MTPVTRTQDAKETDFSAVRNALERFEATVLSVEPGKWMESRFKKEPQEYYDFTVQDVKVIKATSDVVVPEPFNWRQNCATSKNSFWVSVFLTKFEELKPPLVFPDDLIGKRVMFEKMFKSYERKGSETMTSSGFVVVDVKPADKAPEVNPADLEALALRKLEGKTLVGFQMNASLDPLLSGTSLIIDIKSGAFTDKLLKEGKYTLVDNKFTKVA